MAFFEGFGNLDHADWQGVNDALQTMRKPRATLAELLDSLPMPSTGHKGMARKIVRKRKTVIQES